MRFAFALALAACAFAETNTEPPKFRLGSDIQPKRYAIELTLVPNRDNFHGVADEEIDIQTPTALIWLNATAVNITDATFRGGATTSRARILPGGGHFAGLAFESSLSGHGILHIVYDGAISRNSNAGIFQAKDGDEWYIYSQFEPIDARRAFPCFDEPGFKTPWQLTLHIPGDHLAFSNTPVISEAPEAGGMKAVKFKQTAPLPSYLVALAVGRFDVVEAGKVGTVPLRIITPHGRGGEAAYAQAAMPDLLRIAAEQFGSPYPYEKLDSVAMPISNFAMENAGLITYGSDMLLAKPRNDTLDRQQTFAFTAAHEIAHQWFGNLVTAAWWDDIWLSEAFATWMEKKVVAKWRPEWRVDVMEAQLRLAALSLDNLVTAPSIRRTIRSEEDIMGGFSPITYQKGAAILRMFEEWLGPDQFRKGVQLYLSRHAGSNATTSDFSAAMSAAAGQDIAPVFDSFLNQSGAPRVSLKLNCSSNTPTLTLSQKRSLPIGSSTPAKQLWRIPMCVVYGRNGESRESCLVLSEARSEVALRGDSGCPAWVLGSKGETGYYRVDYQGDLLDQLLQSGTKLSTAEKVGILGDVQALVGAGDVSPQKALSLIARFSDESDVALAESAMSLAQLLRRKDVDDNLRPNAARFIRSAFGGRAAKLGWESLPADSNERRTLRLALVPFAASAGEDPALIQTAGGMVRSWLKHTGAIQPDVLGPMLSIAAEFGDRNLFEQLHRAALSEQDARTRGLLLNALGSFRDRDAAKAGLDLLLTNELDIREAFYPLLFGPLAHAETRDLPFQFVTEHIDELQKRLPQESSADFASSLPDTGGAFCDAANRTRIETFFKERVQHYAGGARILNNVLESINVCIARRKALGPDLAAFLTEY